MTEYNKRLNFIAARLHASGFPLRLLIRSVGSRLDLDAQIAVGDRQDDIVAGLIRAADFRCPKAVSLKRLGYREFNTNALPARTKPVPQLPSSPH